MRKSYEQIANKNNFSINNQVSYSFLVSNEFIAFSESVWNFSICFYVFEIIFEIFKIKRTVAIFLCFFITRFYMTLENFPSEQYHSYSLDSFRK